MKTIVEIDEFPDRTREVLRRVRDHGDTVAIIERGRIVAGIVPVPRQPPSQEEVDRRMAELDQLTREISAQWPDGVSAVEAIREQRREL